VRHNLTVLPSDPDTNCLPSGEYATERTERVCPLSSLIKSPDAASHNLIVLSKDPDANCLPSGEYATE